MKKKETEKSSEQDKAMKRTSDGRGDKMAI